VCNLCTALPDCGKPLKGAIAQGFNGCAVDNNGNWLFFDQMLESLDLYGA